MPFGLELKDVINFAAALIAGCVLSYIFYRLSLNRTHLTYAIVERRLIFRSPEYPSELKITFGGEELEAVNRATIYLWNTGNQAITDADLNTTAPLQYKVLEGAKPLQVSVANMSRPANNARLDGTNIEFDYLNPGDGLVIEIFLSRPYEEDKRRSRSVSVEGEVVGIRGGLKEEDASNDFGMVFSMGITGSLMLVASWALIEPVIAEGLTFSFGPIVRTLGAIVFAPIGIALTLWAGHSLFVSKRVPRTLIRSDERISGSQGRFQVTLARNIRGTIS
jgi:hypothetical protein